MPSTLQPPRLQLLSGIRRIAVTETSVSQYHRGPIEGAPEAHRTSQNYRIVGIRRALNFFLHYTEKRQFL